MSLTGKCHVVGIEECAARGGVAARSLATPIQTG
jgi:hypothetical protein